MFVGQELHRRLSAAMVQAVKHTCILVEFNQILDRNRPGIRDEWNRLVRDWDMDPSKPRLYVVEPTSRPLIIFSFLFSYFQN